MVVDNSQGQSAISSKWATNSALQGIQQAARAQGRRLLAQLSSAHRQRQLNRSLNGTQRICVFISVRSTEVRQEQDYSSTDNAHTVPRHTLLSRTVTVTVTARDSEATRRDEASRHPLLLSLLNSSSSSSS
jgi:hypothetical protein